MRLEAESRENSLNLLSQRHVVHFFLLLRVELCITKTMAQPCVKCSPVSICEVIMLPIFLLPSATTSGVE